MIAGGDLHEEHGQCSLRGSCYRGRRANNPCSPWRADADDFRTTQQGGHPYFGSGCCGFVCPVTLAICLFSGGSFFLFVSEAKWVRSKVGRDRCFVYHSLFTFISPRTGLGDEPTAGSSCKLPVLPTNPPGYSTGCGSYDALAFSTHEGAPCIPRSMRSSSATTCWAGGLLSTHQERRGFRDLLSW